MFVGARMPCAFLSMVTLAVYVPAASAQDRRVVTQPATPAPPYCRVLHANLPRLSPTAFVSPRTFDDAIENSPPDTARINQAILQCSQSVAPTGFTPPAVVELAAGGDESASFLSGPIVMQSGVTLLIDPGVALYASRNANEYYNGAGGAPSTCGTLDVSSSGCKNWITINSGSSRRAKNISFIGPGTIDGRGDAVITFTDGTGSGKNQGLACAPSCTWWDLAHQAEAGRAQPKQSAADAVERCRQHAHLQHQPAQQPQVSRRRAAGQRLYRLGGVDSLAGGTVA